MRVFPSKLRSEIFTLTFPFGGLLDVGEQIILADSVVTVSVGVDSVPEVVRYRSPSILGDLQTVTQQVRLGEHGVIYLVTVTAITNLGNEYQLSGHLAIHPDDAPIPPYVGIKYSTELYPVILVESMCSSSPGIVSGTVEYVTLAETADSMRSTSALMNGYLPNFPWGYDLDSMRSVSSLVSGTLSGINANYTVDSMKSSSAIQSGALYPLVPATTTDSMKSISTLISGTVSP